jgi:hypothetical protein
MGELDSERKQKELSWLENLQRNSWEPEVIITGLILAFLFIFPAKIYEFAAYLVQDVGTGYLLSSLVLIYLSIIISVFKIFFSVQLLLRFVWAGLLGLSYAFPKGVIRERLFKFAQSYTYQHPDQMVLKMEKICSMTLAFPVSISSSILLFTIYLGLLIFIKVIFGLSVLLIYFFFLGSIFLFSLFMINKRKSRLKVWYNSSILSSVNATYQSNMGKWFSSVYGVFIMICAVPIIRNDIHGYDLFFNERNMSESDRNWAVKEYIFEDVHPSEKRYARAYAESIQIDGDTYKLGLPYYVEDEKSLQELVDRDSKKLDSLQWGELEELTDLYRFYLDEQLIDPQGWIAVQSQSSGQKRFETVLRLDTLSAGIHSLRVEKVVMDYSSFSLSPKFSYLENWSFFEFIKL